MDKSFAWGLGVVPLKCNPSVDFFLNCQTKHGQRSNCKNGNRSNLILHFKHKIKTKAKRVHYSNINWHISFKCTPVSVMSTICPSVCFHHWNVPIILHSQSIWGWKKKAVPVEAKQDLTNYPRPCTLDSLSPLILSLNGLTGAGEIPSVRDHCDRWFCSLRPEPYILGYC